MRRFLKPNTYNLKPRSGFTLIELLIFTALFATSALGFVLILVAITKIQVRQTTLAEVSGQSQFLLQTIQRYVESSSLIELPANTATATLKLRMASSTQDPLYIYLDGATVFLKQTESGTPEALTSSRVTVSNLSFTKRVNPPGHDSIEVLFTAENNTANIRQTLAQAFDISVARVAAATFDSNVIPSATNQYKIGASSQVWQSVNDLLYFSGSNVGIGVSSPGQTLEVNGGVRLNTTNVQPSCNATQRGTFWVTESGLGAKDAVEVCVKNASDTYLWAPIY